ncbi:hypothetical protein DFJ74DRAFT_655511 [Hyaloraphidium curvatum]|nr:hypothetical protein DFJ74DRAFT_655511 [Hyaloraphidium curvatum]
MRTDDDVRPLAISSEAPAVLARAAEVFVEEMALRSWLHAKAMKRGVVLKEDVSAGARHEMFDFLIDILPRETDFLAKNEEPQPEAHVRAADYYQQYARERAIEADEAEAAAGGNEG